MLNDNNDSTNISFGGADLQCFMIYKSFDKEMYLGLVNILKKNGFKINKDNVAFKYLKNEIKVLEKSGKLVEFVKRAFNDSSKIIAVNLIGYLENVEIKLTVSLHLNQNIIEISTLEDMIWHFKNDIQYADKKQLIAFAGLCRKIINKFYPTHLIIDNETRQFDKIFEEINSGKSRKEPETELSNENIDELFNWYIDTYSKRWS